MLPENPPRVLGKRYRLGEMLGEGASGTVFAAVDLMLGRSIAVKCMKLPHEGGLSLDTHEFVSEAQTIASLNHPQIIDIYDVGVEDDGRPYFVMELVGETLRSVLKSRTRLELEELLALLLPLCGALASAHELGIVHCDVKPENIAVHRLRSGALRGKLLDFSISKQSAVVPVGQLVVGTPGYMAPEQIRGEPCGPATDIWALSTVAVECLSGRLLLAGEGRTRLLRRTATEPAPSVRELLPSLPFSLTLALQRGLSLEPDRRYADMRGFAKALISAALQAGIRVPEDPDALGLTDMAGFRAGALLTTQPQSMPIAAPASTVAASEREPASEVQPTALQSRPAPRRRARVLAVSALSVALVWLAVHTLTRDSSPHGSRAVTGRVVPNLPSPPQRGDVAVRAVEAPLPSAALPVRAELTQPPSGLSSAVITPSASVQPTRIEQTALGAPPSADAPTSKADEKTLRGRAKRERSEPRAAAPARERRTSRGPESLPVPSKDALELKRNWEW